MKFSLWVLAILATAVGLSLFAVHSAGTVTLFLPPHRIDLSLNLTLLLLAGVFALLYAALRAVSLLLHLPAQAGQWRARQHERAMHQCLCDAWAMVLSGRFSKAKKLSQQAQAHAQALACGKTANDASCRAQAMALIVAAEAAHGLQEFGEREQLLQAAAAIMPFAQSLHYQEAAILRSVRGLLEENQARSALQALGTLAQGAQRRTIALRLKLKAMQELGQYQAALDTARLLAKHGGLSQQAAKSLVRGLCQRSINAAHDSAQISLLWTQMSDGEQAEPDLASQAARRLMQLAGLGGERGAANLQARAWLEPVWQRFAQLSESEQVSVAQALETSFIGGQNGHSSDGVWLKHIETAQHHLSHNAVLRYLAGAVCLHAQLWGKAEQFLATAAPNLTHTGLQGRAYQHLALVAEQRGDTCEALRAWKQAAILG